jgi:hypothetical protein
VPFSFAFCPVDPRWKWNREREALLKLNPSPQQLYLGAGSTTYKTASSIIQQAHGCFMCPIQSRHLIGASVGRLYVHAWLRSRTRTCATEPCVYGRPVAIFTKITFFESIAQNDPPTKLFHSANPFVWRLCEGRHTSLCGAHAIGATNCACVAVHLRAWTAAANVERCVVPICEERHTTIYI